LFSPPLPSPWSQIWSALAPLFVPAFFLGALEFILGKLDIKVTPVSLAQTLISPKLRDPNNSRAAARWAVGTLYFLLVAVVVWVHVWLPEKGIPWSGFFIGLAATAGVAACLFILIPMLKIGKEPGRIQRYAPMLTIGLVSVSILVVGLFISPTERTDLLLAVSGNETGVRRLQEEIGELERRDDRLHVIWLDQDIVSYTEAIDALDEEGGELIVYGDIEEPAGETVATSLKILDKWDLLPVDKVPETFITGPCSPGGTAALLRGAAVQTSSVAAFAVAYLDVMREGPQRGLKTLVLAYELSQRINCQGAPEMVRLLADIVYSEMLGSDYCWAQDVELAFRPWIEDRGRPDSPLADPFLSRYWGEIQLREGNLADAVDAFERAIRADPGYLGAYLIGARSAFLNEEHCRARDFFEGFLERGGSLTESDSSTFHKAEQNCQGEAQ